MDIQSLQKNAEFMLKNLNDAHTEALETANDMKNVIITAHQRLGQAIEELSKVADLANEYSDLFKKISERVKSQLTVFENIHSEIIDMDIPAEDFPFYIGCCVECKSDIFSDESFEEKDPGKFYCFNCLENMRSDK